MVQVRHPQLGAGGQVMGHGQVLLSGVAQQIGQYSSRLQIVGQGLRVVD